MRSEAFWSWFESQAAPKLAIREASFRKAFQYLDQLDGPITIVETGCVRTAENWAGDGQSTVLFDQYLQRCVAGSIGVAIDLDPRATALCRSLVSDRITVITGDSVAILAELGGRLKTAGRTPDLLYLDSYDVDWAWPIASAVHHLKELAAIAGALRAETLVMVDDSPASCRVVATTAGEHNVISPPTIGGKGTFLGEYAARVGASPVFAHYQAGWTGMVR